MQFERIFVCFFLLSYVLKYLVHTLKVENTPGKHMHVHKVEGGGGATNTHNDNPATYLDTVEKRSAVHR